MKEIMNMFVTASWSAVRLLAEYAEMRELIVTWRDGGNVVRIAADDGNALGITLGPGGTVEILDEGWSWTIDHYLPTMRAAWLWVEEYATTPAPSPADVDATVILDHARSRDFNVLVFPGVHDHVHAEVDAPNGASLFVYDHGEGRSATYLLTTGPGSDRGTQEVSMEEARDWMRAQ